MEKVFEITEEFERSLKDKKELGVLYSFKKNKKIEKFFQDMIKSNHNIDSLFCEYKTDWRGGFNRDEYTLAYNTLLKNKIDKEIISYMYHVYLFYVLEKRMNEEKYNKVIINLKYAIPFITYLNGYKEEMKKIFEEFLYNDYYIKKLDVEFVNEEYIRKIINKDDE